MGCGDGRLAVALCLEGSGTPLSVLQQLQSSETQFCDPPAGDAIEDEPLCQSYVGIDICEPLALKARRRLASAGDACVVLGDFLQPMPREACGASFDSVLIAANTLFTTPHHAQLLERAASALDPGGTLLLDVYNALLYHPVHEEEGEWVALHEEDETLPGRELEPGSLLEAEDAEGESNSELLVRVTDEEGQEWEVHEPDPLVERAAQTITCLYDFSAKAERLSFRESLVHHYLLPEQLVRLIDSSGFAIEHIFGDFQGGGFDPDESEHLVVVADDTDGGPIQTRVSEPVEHEGEQCAGFTHEEGTARQARLWQAVGAPGVTPRALLRSQAGFAHLIQCPPAHAPPYDSPKNEVSCFTEERKPRAKGQNKR
eukprot:CAMPEP_0183343724 /NCGR_PEP_ID=MMETSP0164_2-20130417/9562_1 /TAXON_ID=221442 /ORGANISM="Coccolithus pelagicus ssp braarudi, Strain PLY182g" /LENGTH=371 /DNA_ID=CAMNT_0025514599 /DNA_START=1 /DNA_END=1114 /DNA_ORIENTATION=+